MPKILIICDVYPPSFAPRMGYLVKHSKKWGWSADIVTRNLGKDRSFQSLLGNELILRVNELKATKKNKINIFFQVFKQKWQYKSNVKKMVNVIIQELDSKEYALILCSTAHRTYILEVALKISQKWNKKWIADIRDLDEQRPNIRESNKGPTRDIISYLNERNHDFFLRRRDMCLAKSDTAVSISPWHVEVISRRNPNTRLIYNGFDPETYFPFPLKKQEKFKIIYTGTVHYGRHDPGLLLAAVKILSENQIINPLEFCIHFYVPQNWRRNIINHPMFQQVEEYIQFFDYVDTAEVPMLLNSASILLLLSNLYSPDGPKGLISTTKYFEYLAVERPILCVRSDENLLESSLKKSKAGISARSLEEAYEFILMKWQEWKRNGFTTINVDRDYINQFSRKRQARQFVELFDNLIQD